MSVVYRYLKRFVLLLLRVYRVAISPLFPPCCRYWPTCSCYAREAVERFGVIRGGWLACRRLLRCHPFSRHPLVDPVPREWPRTREAHRPPQKEFHG